MQRMQARDFYVIWYLIDRKNVPAYLNDFPYVNGGLFEKVEAGNY